MWLLQYEEQEAQVNVISSLVLRLQNISQAGVEIFLQNDNKKSFDETEQSVFVVTAENATD